MFWVISTHVCDIDESITSVLGKTGCNFNSWALRATKNEAHDSSADLSKASESAWNLPWLVLRTECSLVFQDAL